MWAYVHRDPMGSWQMARHGHTQMPTSYLAHLCQDKTHEAGMESSSWGNKIWVILEEERRGLTWRRKKMFFCLIIKNSYHQCCCVCHGHTRLIIFCVQCIYAVEIINTSLCIIRPMPLSAIHPACYPWNEKKLNW